VLVVLCVSQLMIVLDSTVVYFALPIIQRELHFSQSSLAWVVNAYLLTFGGFLLLAGRYGDLIGRRQVLLVGVGAFAFSSLLCGLAPNAAMLVVARFVQGASAAMVASMVLGIISPMFPERRERTLAFSIYAFVAVGGVSLGLVLGGIITELLNWHWIFYINVPIGTVVLILGKRLLTDQPGLGIREGADILGAVLITSAPMLAVFGVINAGSSNWGSTITVASLAGSVFLVGVFVFVEAHTGTPLIPLRIFRHRNLLGATVVRFLYAVGPNAIIFLGALYFEHVLGYSPLRTGLAFLPWTLVTGAICLIVVPRLVPLFELKTLVVSGLALLTAGVLAMDRITVHSGFVTGTLPAMLLTGLGSGLLIMPSTTLAMSDVAETEAGVASGLCNVASQLGVSIGIAAIATITDSQTTHLLAEHETTASALTGGYRLGFFVSAGFTTLSLIAALVILRPHQPKRVEEIPIEEADAASLQAIEGIL
jgi:EmrB/QacA subfamily drug resistance transporter